MQLLKLMGNSLTLSFPAGFPESLAQVWFFYGWTCRRV
jgi:hypothetical protein